MFGTDIEFQKNPLLGVCGGGPVSAEVGVENVKRLLRRRFSRHRFHLERKSLHARLQLHLHSRDSILFKNHNSQTRTLLWGGFGFYLQFYAFVSLHCVSLTTKTATLEEEKEEQKKNPFRFSLPLHSQTKALNNFGSDRDSRSPGQF